MKTLIVTATSKSKQAGGITDFKKKRHTFLESLPRKEAEKLLALRTEILQKTGEKPAFDTEPSKEKTVALMPAYQRCTGRTFSKIPIEVWHTIGEDQDLDAVIVTPFYGLILFDDPIRNYDLKSVDKLEGMGTVKTFWKKNRLGEILKSYILSERFERVVFVLSQTYSQMIDRERLSMELEDNHGIICSYHQFKEFGRASMLERGKFITQFVLEKRDQKN